MSGGSQAYLIEASDSNCYVVKFTGNPQGTLTLVNDFIGSSVFRLLKFQTSFPALIHVGADFLAANPEIQFQLANRTVPIRPGCHFGSQYPGHPDRNSVFDMFPASLWHKLENAEEFCGALIADQWLCNIDYRQSIFVRTTNRMWRAVMVDFGQILGGRQWRLDDRRVCFCSHYRPAYNRVLASGDVEHWLHGVETFPDETLWQIVAQLPDEWVSGEALRLEQLMERLLRRRRRVGVIIEDLVRSPSNPFPNWRVLRPRGAGSPRETSEDSRGFSPPAFAEH